MDRIVGVETEYGCLLSEEEPHLNSDVWPAKVKNYLFRKANAGTIDLHYRDYEEPPGNGGVLFYRGRPPFPFGNNANYAPGCFYFHHPFSFQIYSDDLPPTSP